MENTRHRIDPSRRALAMGIGGALVAVGVGQILFVGNHDAAWRSFVASAAIAAFATGYALWRKLVGGRANVPARRGMAVGALAGAIAHVPTWLLVFLAFGDDHGHPGARPPGVLDAILRALVASLVSLVVIGWITVPAGALIGALLARAQSRHD